jgi:hypothetical protein
VYLPDRGMKKTKRFLNDVPMTKELRIEFLDRLKEIRNFVVTDIKLTAEEKVLVKGEKAK